MEEQQHLYEACLALLEANGFGKEQATELLAQVHESQDRRRQMLRGLMNSTPPEALGKLTPAYFAAQDAVLQQERRATTITDADKLPRLSASGVGQKLALWQGDICTLRADAVVNAANSGLLGCFRPLHRCIDNAIHSAAGLQLRQACAEAVVARAAAAGVPPEKYEEPTGEALLTPGFNLPAAHVLHTVGPIYPCQSPEENAVLLARCYTSCLETAAAHGLRSVAFCCISTGEFMYPREPATEIAVSTVVAWLRSHPSTSIELVVFNVFTDEDLAAYQRVLATAV